MKQGRSQIYMGIAAVIVLFFGVIAFMTPYFYDDVLYCYHMGTVMSDVPKLMTSFSDMVGSYIPHIEYKNGRCFSNIFIQGTLTNFMPVWMHAVMNTLVFLGTAIFLNKWLLSKLNAISESMKAPVFLLVLMMLFMLTPESFGTFFWRAGASNYLWPGFFYSMLFYFYFTNKHSWWLCVLFAFCGVLHEGFAVPMLVFLGLDFLIKPSWKKVVYGLCLAATVATIFITPVEARGSGVFAAILSQFGLWKIFDFAAAFMASPAFVGLVVLLMMGWFMNRQMMMEFVKKNRRLFILVAGYLLMFAIIGRGGGVKKYYPVHLITVVMMAEYLLTAEWFKERFKSVLYVAGIVFVVFAVNLTRNTLVYGEQYKEEVKTFKTDKNGIVLNDYTGIVTIPVEEEWIVNHTFAHYYRDSIQIKTLPPIVAGLNKPVYDGIYKTNAYCTKEHETVKGLYEYQAPRKKYGFFELNDDVKKGDVISCRYDHVVCSMGGLNKLLDKVRPAKMQEFEIKFVLNTEYGKRFAVIDLPPNLGYKVTSFSIKQ